MDVHPVVAPLPVGDPGTGGRIETLISRQCRHAPETVVAVSDSGSMTFGELERLSDRLARRLRELGVSPGSFVIVSLDRDRLLLVAIVAVLKAGAAFIPVELPEPPDRIERTARLAGAVWVVTDLESVATYEAMALRIVLVDDTFLHGDDSDGGPGDAGLPRLGGDDPAYGISTSGSTGTPKTVAVAHRPLISLVEWIGHRFGIGAGDTGLWVSPGSFDLSVFDLLGLPALGASVRMLPGPSRVDPARCAEVLTREPITFWNSTPALLQSVLPFVRGAGAEPAAGESLRLVFVSGDWVPLSLKAELRRVFPRAELVALGGATEATIWSNYFVVGEVDPSWTSIPYGQPVPWARYYVLDPDGRQCADDERGELHIGGDCLAIGYLGDQELTSARFPADPFATEPGARMYRTGDAARRWPDGTIELLGRLDDQVNASGYRVELGEVEAALSRCGLSAAAAVAVPNVAGTQRIVAAGVPAEPGLTADTVLARLAAVLPAYAHPTPLLLVDRLPLTANGKIDRKAVARLAAPATGDRASPAVPTAVRTEDVAAVLRAEIAAIVGAPADGIGADRPLGELGLNSLGFAVLSGRVFQTLGVTVSPVDFYEAGTLDNAVARIAAMMPHTPTGSAAGSPPAPVPPRDTTADVAVVGMSCRMPGAGDLDAFWDLMVRGAGQVRPLPERRARLTRAAPTVPAGYLDQIDEFDARLFGITPREADLIDPRQRLMLQAVWTAIEDAGEDPLSLRGSRVGVFVGATGDDFARLCYQDPDAVDGHTLTGVAPSIIANRVSYVFDLTGPSEVVDTACSSSLVALHRAVSAIGAGECEAAIVGGVSLMLDAGTDLALERVGMLSSTGRCWTFDARADGYARGEGVGVVYLKAIGRARADGNRVRCRIIGSAVNHSGRTTSLTAPSPAAQRDVIRTCHRRAGVDPRTIGMIEAHGTGTALGDPIEARALVDAFREPGTDTGGRPSQPDRHCAVTAVKTNIGHLEAASGIAGLIKAALAVRRGVVPPLADFGVANDLVDLDGSPLFLCTEPTPWPTGPGGPRRAGVSSFGFGGANAHVVLEFDEAVDDPPRCGPQRNGPHLLVASGVDRAALRRRVTDLLGYLDRQANLPAQERDPLEAISYTTLTGRPALADRLACVTGTIDGARAALRAWLAGDPEPTGSIIGPDRPPEPTGPDTRPTALHALAREWTAGRPVDWAGSIACPDERPTRVALPTYPFAGTSHWPSHLRAAEPDSAGRTRFELADYADVIDAHRVGGRPVLPAAVLLAVFQRVAHQLTGGWAVRLADVRFAGGDRPVPSALAAIWERTDAGWLVRLADQDEHTRATATLSDQQEPPGDPDDPPNGGRELDAWICYEQLAAAGVELGPPLRGIERVRVTPQWCHAELSGPAAGDDRPPGCDPALLDAALQAALVWQLETAPLAGLPVPTGIGSVVLHAPMRDRATVTVRADGPAGARRPRVTAMTIADDRGHPVAHLAGVRAAPFGKDGAATTTLLVHQERPVTGGRSGTPPGSSDVVVVGGAGLAAELGRRGMTVTRFAAEPGTPVVPGALTVVELGARDWRADSAVLLETVRAMIGARPQRPATVLAVYALDEPASDPGPAVAALARTLRLEHPGLRLFSIGVRADAGPAHLAEAVLAATAGGHHRAELMVFDPARATLRAVGLAEADPNPRGGVALRDGGGYLIAGGLGGIGFGISRQLLARHEARLVLCGRSPDSDPRIANRLGLLRANGEVHYVAADLTSEADVRQLVRTSHSLIGPIHGVLHCAGILRDRLLTGCDVAEALAVAAPKLSGAVHLDLATADEEVDFLALFSSLVATTGAVGQGAYGLANGWLESFARDRAARRSGRTLAIGWGPWDTDGMRMPAETLTRLADRHGLVEFDADTGVDALAAALRLDAPVAVAVRGDRRRLLEWITAPDPSPVPSPAPVTVEPIGDVGQVKDILLAAIAAESGLAPDEIAADARFEDYGLDSSLIVAVTGRLEEVFGELPVTLLFEHRSLDTLAAHLAGRHPGTRASAPPVRARDQPPPRAGDIAVIGMAGRFPLADDLTEFWHNLVRGRDCVRSLPADRWATNGSAPTQWGGFLDGWNRFDHAFFAVSRTEAEMMDPQERLFLECAYHALEDAGYPPPGLAGGAVGVYAGVMWGQYQLYGADTGATASSYGSIAHRVSHFFDFTGPSIALDTMCSSSLTAIHLACQSLRAGGIRMAVVGGVNVDTHPAKHRFLVRRRFASPDGRTRAFGAGGDGYVPGEGVAVVVLKPLRDALTDRDRIHGVIKGSAINHDGHTRGLTVPNPTAQADVITAALADAGVDAATVDYVETHGTGTALGDPIEVRALSAALGPRGRPCPIGSVKPNIGHLESAAGLAGMIKVLLQFRHGVLVPSIHSDPPNEHIDFAATPLYVQMTCADWTVPEPDSPRRAGISSFGAGGANAHLIVEEPPAPAASRPAPEAGREWPVVLSAMNTDRLAAAARSLLSWLRADRSELPGRVAEPNLVDISYTSLVARQAMPARLAIIAADLETLAAGLVAHLDGHAAPGLHTGSAPRARATEPGRVDALLAVRDLAAVAELWCAGAEIGWRALFEGHRPRLTDQPGYPFARTRCWTPVPAVPAPAHSVVEYDLPLNGVTPADPPWRGAVGMVAALAGLGGHRQSVLHLSAVTLRYPTAGPAGLVARVSGAGDGELTVVDPSSSRVPLLTARLEPANRLGAPLRACRMPAVTPPDSAPVTAGSLTLRAAPAANAVAATFEVAGDDPGAFLTDLLGFVLEQAAERDGPGVPDAVLADVLCMRGVPVRSGSVTLHRQANRSWECVVADDTEPVIRIEGLRMVHQAASTQTYADTRPGIRELTYEIACRPSDTRAAPLGELTTAPVLIVDAGAAGRLAELRRTRPTADTVLFAPGRESDGRAVASFCRLVEALRDSAGDLRRLVLLTGGGIAATASERPDPVAAMFLGLGLTATRELPKTEVRLLDVTATARDRWLRDPAELPVPDTGAPHALRDGVLYRRGLRRAGGPAEPPPAFRRGGGYVLVGGGGAVGRTITDHLVTDYDAKVAWIGRRAGSAVRDGTGLPRGVTYHRADVTDGTALDRALDEVVAGWGSIDGVLHLGAEFDFRRLADASAADADALMSAKVLGSRVLLDRLADRDPGFVCFMSSAEVLAGNIGLGCYTGACAYQDALALASAGTSPFPVRVVNWGYWAGAERVNPRTLAARGVRSLDADTCMRALSSSVRGDRTQLVVLDAGEEVLRRMGLFAAEPPAIQTVPSTNGQHPPVDVVGVLTELLADTLGLRAADIDPTADIARYGLDSILFLDFADAIEKMFGRVPVEELIALDTVRDVAALVVAQHPTEHEVHHDRAAGSTTEPAGPVALLEAAEAVRVTELLLDYPRRFDEPATGIPVSDAGLGADCFRQRLVAGAGGVVEVLSCGQGPPLLLIAGIGLTAPIFHAQFEAFRSDWTVLTVHAPGHGRSDPPGEASTAAYAGTIAETLGLLRVDGPVHVVASCFGTIVAQYLAATRPELVASITLCGAGLEGVAIPAVPPEGLSAREVARLTEAAAASLGADFDTISGAPGNRHIRDHIAASRALLMSAQKASPSVGMKYLNEVLGLRPSEWARDIAAPTLFVAGTLDTVVPPEAAYQAAAHFRTARVVDIANAGHYPFLTHAATFNAALARFLWSLDR